MRRFRRKLTYANLTSTLALFIALTGAGAYAANQLADKSVGERQLRPGAVTADKIRKNAVTAPKIKGLAVKQGKLANGSVTAAKMTPAAIEARSLAVAAVTNEKLAPDAVTGDKVAESTLSQVPSANTANFATAAESANPPAFAAVDFEGNLNLALSKGITDADVVRKSAGVYCIAVPAFNPRGAQVTPRNPGEGGISAYVTIGGTASCPAPQVEVETYKGVLTSEAFYVSLYR
jgi:hypothetical protein